MKWAGWAVAVVCAVVLLWTLDQSDAKVAEWADRAQVAESLRKAADDKARSDSLALVRLQQDYAADSLRLAQERDRSRQEAKRARQDGKRASEALRATLDAQQAVLLDSLDTAHAREIQALESQVQVADSATVVERSLRVATEQALASERLAYQALTSSNSALQGQIEALEAARKGDRLRIGGFAGGTLTLAILAVVILR